MLAVPTINAYAPLPLRLRSVRRETADTFTLRFDPASLVAAGLPGGLRFAPGQFNMLYAFGMGEVAISISGDPDRPLDLVHTVRAVGGVTKALCRLRKGGVVGVRGPYGVGWPVDESAGADVVVVAGGLGLAPLRPAILRLLRRRGGGRLAILVGARTPADLVFRRELEQWTRRRGAEVRVTVDRADASWGRDVGVVPALIRRAGFDPASAVAMVCGPEVMMRYAERALAERGVAASRVFVSMERNMKCAVASCGHCQLGPAFVCKDGPVLTWDRIGPFAQHREA